MRSTSEVGAPPLEDLTARARIRDTALELFAQNGFEGATIREIARRAGVSPGLVQHHFRSKDALRQACDDAVLELVHRKLAATRDGRISDPSFLASLFATAPAVIRYVARAVADGSSAGDELFDHIAAGTEGFLSLTWPDRFPAGSARTGDAAAVLVAQAIGTIALHPHIARRMHLVPWEPRATPRIGMAQLDVYEALGEYVSTGPGRDIREATEAMEANDATERRDR
jgi:AcrR family transcriptional regulator